MTTDQLKETIEFLRANGVAHYKGPIVNVPAEAAFQVELLLVDKPTQIEFPKPEKPAGPFAKVPRGKDGLTAQEQEDLYGAVVDAEPPEK